MAQKRSNQYDWFKGAQANGGKKTPKENAKRVWKVTKIFIYLALFVFSMTGCIQSLIIKTTNYVGTGAEFYSNSDEVAPHVSVFDIHHGSTTTGSKDIYTAGTEKANYWLSGDVMQADGKSSLKKVHEAVKEQSTKHVDAAGKGTLKLEDAFKGSNEAVKINVTDKTHPTAADNGVATDTAGNVLVLSSLADKSAFTRFATADKDLLQGIQVYSSTKVGAKTTWSVAPMDAGTLSNYEKDYVSQVAKLFVGQKDNANTVVTEADVKSILKKDTVALAKTQAHTSFGSRFDPAAMIKFDTSIDSIAADLAKDSSVKEARQAYSLSVLKTILKADPNLLNWLTTPVVISGGASLTDVMTLSDDKLNDAQKEDRSIINAHTAVFKAIITAANLQANGDSVTVDGLHFAPNVVPFAGAMGKTNWRPLVTWGDAWGEGPFYGIFVYPVATISAKMIASFPGGMQGWETLITIFVVVFSMRFLAFLLSFKATMQQTRMQELAAKKAIIDAKYAPYKGNKQMENRQRQEVSEMYKKQGVSPFGSMTSIFITMPLFLSIWRTIGALPHIKSAVWLGINFSATSWRELFHGSFQYLPLMILAAGFAAFQQILPRLLTKRRDRTRINVQQKAAMKKGNKTQNIMMLVFVFMSLIFSAGLQVYWIAGGIWMTIQSTLTHFLIIRQSKNKKRKKIKV